MSILDYEFILTRTNGILGIWNFYPTLEAAQADQTRANASDPGCQYEPMTWEAYKLAERNTMLADGPVQITEAKFMEMLEVLPPLKWTNNGSFESFLMSEFFSGPYTSQYARRGDTYWTKMVDATDKSTWMS